MKKIKNKIKSFFKNIIKSALQETLPDALSKMSSYKIKDSYHSKDEDISFPVDTAEIKKFKDSHLGKRCFIIGNGPSLNKINLEYLKNEISFGVNGIFYKTDEQGFIPTYYMVEDGHVVNDNLDKINKYKTTHRFFPSIYSNKILKDSRTSFFLMNKGFYEKNSPYFSIPRFSMDCSEKIYCGQSVTIMNLQLAHYMGFKSVYLIGMDFSYAIPDSAKISGLNIESTEDDPNHFHPEYFGRGKKWHDPQLDKVKRSYEHCKFIYEITGRKIYNASVGGKLEVFERVDFESLFK